jgi:hypothetical protein
LKEPERTEAEQKFLEDSIKYLQKKKDQKTLSDERASPV